MKLKLSDGVNQEMNFARNHVKCVKMLCAVLAFLLSLSLTAKVTSAKTPFNTITTAHVSYTVAGESPHRDIVGAVIYDKDEMLAEQAVYSCRCAITTDKKLFRALENARRLLAVERQHNIPEFMIGMTLAAACSESCYNDKAEGDHKFSKRGKPKAIGILQLWPWVEKYGVVRTNLESSASFWLKHIQKQLPKVKKRCKPRTKTLAWKQAWVTAVRAPKKGGRCREVTKHWRRFKKIQKIKSKIEDGELDGC